MDRVHSLRYLSFGKKVRGLSWEEMKIEYERVVREEYDRQEGLGYLNPEKIPSQNHYLKEHFQGIQEGTNKPTTASMMNLAKILHLEAKRKVVVLIDEYDTPITCAHEGGFLHNVSIEIP